MDRQLDEAITYARFADRWNWPPTVVDEQPAWLVHALLEYAVVADEVRSERSS